MNYIKLFESFDKSQFYREVNRDEYRKVVVPGLPKYKEFHYYQANFNPEKLEIVLNLLHENGWKRDDDTKTEIPHYSFGRCDIEENGKRIICRNLQLNPLPTMFRNYPITIREMPDEWYAVDMEGFNDKFYICDQLDGLLEFLNDMKYFRDKK
jgi:hypothetical protein